MSSEFSSDSARAAIELLRERLQRPGEDVLRAIEDLQRAHPGSESLFAALRELCLALRAAAASCSFRELRGSGFSDAEAVTVVLDEEPLAAGSGLAQTAGSATSADRYVVQDEVARGGMGIVYRVRDREFNRTLAMKVLAEGRPESTGGSSVSALSRFLEEAQVTAQLDHPGIVAVHDLGMTPEGQPFFTMKLVKGRDFSAIVKLAREGAEGWNLSRAVGVLVKVCQTVAYAHAKKVIHRDLKPSNIMVGRFGEVHLMDWGLAKITGREDLHDLRVAPASPVSVTEIRSPRRSGDSSTAESPLITLDGSVVGTPAFMAPEQARGETAAVDHQSDVYSLGAVLYQLLTGQPPYVEPGSRISPRTILARVLDGAPKPVTSLNRAAPPELIAICDKAMAREKPGRYATAEELAEDLQAWLDHRVVRAYRTGPAAELGAWVGRNRLAAGVAVAAFLMLFALGGWWVVRERDASLALRGRLARQYLREGQALSGSGRLDAGLHLLARAWNECPATEPALAQEIQINLSGWAAHGDRLLQMLDHESGQVRGGVYAPGLPVAFFADGTRLITGGNADRTARIWSVATGAPVGQPMRHASAVTAVLAVPQNDRIVTVTAEGVVQLWSESGEAIGSPWMTNAGIRTLSGLVRSSPAVLSPAGPWVAVSRPDQAVEVWSAETGRRIAGDMIGTAPVVALAFSGDGQRLVVGYDDGAVRTWALPSGTPGGEVAGRAGGPVLGLSADATHMVVATEERSVVRIRSLEDRGAAGVPLQHDQPIMRAVFSPDGTAVATIDEGRMVFLWSVADGSLLAPAMRRSDAVTALAFSPDSRLLLTGSVDFSAALWSVASGEPIGIPMDLEGTVRHVAFSRSGDMIVASAAGQAEIWSAAVQPQTERVYSFETRAWDFDFAPDGSSIAVSGVQGLLKVFPLSAPESGGTIPLPGRTIWCVRFSPDGRYLAAGAGGGVQLRLVDGEAVVSLNTSNDVRSLAFDAGGTRLATGDFGGRASVWSVPGGEVVAVFRHPEIVEEVDFYPDGSRLVTACGDGKVRVWSLAEGTEALPAMIHGDAVLAVSLSPDGNTIASGSRDRTVRFWDARTGRPVGPILRHANWVEDLEFDARGRWIVTACTDGTVQLWSMATGERLGPPLVHEWPVRAAGFDPAGTHLVTVSDEPGGVHRWALPLLNGGAVVDPMAWVEVLTGKRMDANGVLSRLSPAEWQDARRSLPRASSQGL